LNPSTRTGKEKSGAKGCPNTQNNNIQHNGTQHKCLINGAQHAKLY